MNAQLGNNNWGYREGEREGVNAQLGNNNWGYLEGEREGVNAQEITTGVIVKERERV